MLTVQSQSPEGRGRVESQKVKREHMRETSVVFCLVAAITSSACQEKAPAAEGRVSGQVDATEVQIAPEVGGRIVEMTIAEGDRVKQGDVVARLDTARRRSGVAAGAGRTIAGRCAASAAAGRRARRRHSPGRSPGRRRHRRIAAAEAELASAETDLQRFERLLQMNSGSQKQRDDAATRREWRETGSAASRAREAAAREGVARLRAGSRREEIEAARARVAAVDAQIATLEKSKAMPR